MNLVVLCTELASQLYMDGYESGRLMINVVQRLSVPDEDEGWRHQEVRWAASWRVEGRIYEKNGDQKPYI